MIKPNVFIVGAPKCGTTSLAYYLNEHRDIFVCNPKEPNYFSDDINNNHLDSGIKLNCDVDYLSLFDNGNVPIRIDASTTYLYSKHAPKKIKKFSPSAKIIIMIRNPTELVESLHQEELHSFEEDLDSLIDAWNMQDKRRVGECVPKTCRSVAKLMYRDIASHTVNIKRYFDVFGEDSVKVILLEDLKNNPSDVYNNTLKFLGLNQDGRADFPIINNAKLYRNRYIAKLIKSPGKNTEYFFLFIRNFLWSLGLKGVRSSLLKFMTKSYKKRAPYRDRALIGKEFEKDIQSTSKLISRNLDHWIIVKEDL